MPKDYYLVLGISRGADLKKIKKAYRTIAKRYHPDICGEKESGERFLEIKEAYDTLSDQQKKLDYDNSLDNNEPVYRVNRVSDKMRERISRWRRVESLFTTGTDDFFEGFIQGLYEEDKGKLTEKDLYFEAILSPDEAASGGLYPLTVPVMVKCPVCSQSGLWEGLFCPLCNGFRKIQSKKEFSLSIPPNVRHGTEISVSLEGIGLKNSFLHLKLSIVDY